MKGANQASGPQKSPLNPARGARIRQARMRQRLSQAEVGKALDVSRAAVAQWEAGKGITDDNLMRLAEVLCDDYDRLKSGESKRSIKVAHVPLRGRIAGGVWRAVTDISEAEVEYVPVAPDRRFPLDAQYALRVEGQSVDKVAPHGAIIHCLDLISGGVAPQDGDLVVVERRDRAGNIETTVKRLRNGSLMPESADPRFSEPIPYKTAGAEVEIKAIVLYVTVPASRFR